MPLAQEPQIGGLVEAGVAMAERVMKERRDPRLLEEGLQIPAMAVRQDQHGRLRGEAANASANARVEAPTVEADRSLLGSRQIWAERLVRRGIELREEG